MEKFEIRKLSKDLLKIIILIVLFVVILSIKNIAYAGTYTIVYNGNGGKTDQGKTTYSETKVYGQASNLMSNQFKKAGYKFKGWFAQRDNGTWNKKSDRGWAANLPEAQRYIYKNGESVAKTGLEGRKVTLYAVWEANSYKVTFNANGGSGGPTGTYPYSSDSLDFYIPRTTPTRNGYKFIGWSTSKSATIATYLPEKRYSNPGKTFGYQNITLYAVWGKDENSGTYTIVYNGNGGKTQQGKTTYSETRTYGVAGNLIANQFTRSGYTFVGWYAQRDDGTWNRKSDRGWEKNISNAEKYVYSDRESVAKTGVAGHKVTLYAVWKESVIAVNGLNINPTSMEITVGKSQKITATISPSNATNKGVTYNSSNTSVATVDKNGNVRGVKAGIAKITVTANGDKHYHKECTVTVKSNVVVATGIKISPTSKTIKVGETFKIIPTITPSNASNKKVTYSTSQTGIITMSNGVVKGLKEGTTVITATTSNGKTATCKVTVEPKTVVATGIKISPTSKTIKVGETFKIIPTITPSNASNKKVTYSTSQTGIITMSNGVVKGLKEGTTVITATTSNGKTATCKVTVEPKTVVATGIKISPTSKTIKVGETFKITPTISPSNVTNKNITYKSDSDNTTVDSNGKVKGVKEGIAEITVTTSNGKTATCKVTVQAAQSSGGGPSAGGTKKYQEGSISSKYYSEFKSNRKTWESDARYVYNRLIEAGATPEGAAGAIGNITQECRWNKKTYTKNITNKYGTFYGMVMWGGNRRINLQKRANYDTIAVQTDFMIHELTTSYTSVWKTLTTTHDVITASNKFQKNYEICGDGTVQRQEFSIDWYNYLNGITKY